ncbi:MAG: AraC family transcriptional regulator [Paracoccaceae bacterium]
MSHAISVCHGEFGRAALYHLDKTIITHAHREGHLIFYVDGSEGEAACEAGACPINESNAAAISPWEPHSFHVPENETHICLVLYIKPMWFLENSDSAEYALRFGSSQLEITKAMRDPINKLVALLLNNEEQTNFDQLLFGLTRMCFDLSWSGNNDLKHSDRFQRFNDFRVRRSLRLIQEKMGEDIEMEKLARCVGLSRPHFFKLFKQYMGVTPNVYMNTLRSERAIDELLNTDKTVTDIGFDLGFSSQASFTRFFSSNVGIAPSEYRRVAHVSSSGFPMM